MAEPLRIPTQLRNLHRTVARARGWYADTRPDDDGRIRPRPVAGLARLIVSKQGLRRTLLALQAGRGQDRPHPASVRFVPRLSEEGGSDVPVTCAGLDAGSGMGRWLAYSETPQPAWLVPRQESNLRPALAHPRPRRHEQGFGAEVREADERQV